MREHTIEGSRFAVGDRVIAKPDTIWDADIKRGDPDWKPILLAGHYGHIVIGSNCRGDRCQGLHVLFEGCADTDREPSPFWLDGTHWHMEPEELEHID